MSRTVTDSTGLYLTRGPLQWAIDHRPVSIGRQPECDITLGGEKVSRIHAYVVPTPSGPLLVDRSRLGTVINGEQVNAPWVLAEGDRVEVGGALLHVERRTPAPHEPQPPTRHSPARLWGWIRRYGPSEVLGTVAAVGAAVAVREATGSTAIAAYAGTIAETTVFYGILFLRESIREAHRAGLVGRPYGTRDLIPVLHSLVMEFGIAEALDVVLFRPACLAVGINWIGGTLGALAGKLAADLAFYGPVLTVYEWRLARRTAASHADHRRRTTAGHRLEAQRRVNG